MQVQFSATNCDSNLFPGQTKTKWDSIDVVYPPPTLKLILTATNGDNYNDKKCEEGDVSRMDSVVHLASDGGKW